MNDAAARLGSEGARSGIVGDCLFERRSALACASAVFIFGSLATLIMPALLQGWADQLHLTESRLGWLASFELGGTAMGSLSAFLWQRRLHWRQVTVFAIMLIVLVNLASTFTTDFARLGVLRLLSGTGGGVLVGIYTAYLANTRSPEKYLAATTFAQILVQSALLSLSSTLLGWFGMTGMYALLSVSLILLLPLLGSLPARWPRIEQDVDAPTETHTRRSWALGSIILGAFIPFFAFQGGTFAFLQQFGERGAGLAPAETLRLIGFSSLGSGGGPIAAYLLAERAGVMLPLAGSLLLMALTMLGLTIGGYSTTVLLCYMCVLQAAWLFAICYLYAGLIKANNVLTQAGSPLSAVFLAAGTSIMGAMVERAGLDGILTVALACLALTAVMTLPALHIIERHR